MFSKTILNTMQGPAINRASLVTALALPIVDRNDEQSECIIAGTTRAANDAKKAKTLTEATCDKALFDNLTWNSASRAEKMRETCCGSRAGTRVWATLPHDSSVVGNCNSFKNNRGFNGGAIRLDQSSIILNKDVFTGNTADVSFFDSLNYFIYFSLLSFMAFLFLTALFYYGGSAYLGYYSKLYNCFSNLRDGDIYIIESSIDRRCPTSGSN
jgi:hypothetical protein